MALTANEECCNKPNIARHDYERPFDRQMMHNRVCLHCGTHWHGEPNAVRQWSRRDWDRALELKGAVI